MSTILEAAGVSVRYGPFVAVDDVSISLDKGEVLSICGRNGAGKSSLINSLIGLEERSGVVRVNDQVLASRDTKGAVRAGMAVVLERRGLFPSLSVETNLHVAGFGKGARTRRGLRNGYDLDRTFEFFPDLEAKRNAPAGSLSGGQQQMLAIGRALVSRPSLLLLDEPSMGLAPQMINAVFSAISALKGEGLSIILVEENPQRALQVADRLMVLERGTVRLNAPAEHVRRHPDEFKAAYFGTKPGVAAAAEIPGALPA